MQREPDLQQAVRGAPALAEEAAIRSSHVTGEHGVGLLEKQGLEAELSPAVLDLHRSVKRALDPRGILDPGKVV